MSVSKDHMGDPINLTSYKYVFTTYATERFRKSLDIWLNIHSRHAAALPNGRLIVWLGADWNNAAGLKAAWPAVDFRQIPTDVPVGGFADYWAAEHYAWKLWILKTLTGELAGDEKTMLLYIDSGAIMIRVPEEMMYKAAVFGTCFVEDTTQKNLHWFSDAFKKILNVQDFELHTNQIQAATIVLVPARARALVNAAYTMSLNRDIIVGPKWQGTLPSGQPFGHRHDQAILSLLRLRHGIPVVQIGSVQNTVSMKNASESGAAFYVHRGDFVTDKNGLEGFSEVFVVNLERRADRLAKFYENHPTLKSRVKMYKAVDGCALKLTAPIARLLRPNDFFWKKAVAGCALSHLGLWHRLATEEGPDSRAFLILEDDVKLMKDWEGALNIAMRQTPENWDVLYLGGVLPQNWPAFETVKERVNGGPWCRVAENKIFGQHTPTRYFHFCTYAYVLSKRGAQKLLALIQARDGFFTSADHMMCNHGQLLNLYFLEPKVAGCTQEDDPAYLQSAFNNYNRIDTFDSDLWTNDERWTQEERVTDGPLDIAAALAGANAALRDVNQEKKIEMSVGERNLLVRMIGADESARDKMMEIEWLEEMLNCNIWIEPMVQTSAEFKPKEVPWVIVSRQDINKWIQVFKFFESEGRNFYAIHLSDEFGRDDISWYKSPMCKGVIRNYWRADAASVSHVTILPLGYAKGTAKHESTGKACTTVWSFEGTNWFDRERKLVPLKEVTPYELKLFKTWNDPEQKSRTEYGAQLRRSIFVPIVRGNHFETFRMYESLEAGCIPIYVREPGDEEYWAWLSRHVMLANITSWESAARYMKFFLANPEHMNKYRNSILEMWAKWKSELKAELAKII